VIRRVRSLVVVALVGLLATSTLASCSKGKDTMTAVAVFDDVADMANGALVQMADVKIGQVTSIKLVGSRARVSMTFERAARVPLDVTARVRRTSVIGEKFIELRPDTEDVNAPLLRDGATIKKSEVVPDLEQLVGSGTAVFGALSASELGTLIAENAKGFGGKGATLAALIDDLDRIMAGFRTRTDTVTRLVDAIDELASDLSPSARANAEAIANLATTTQILNEQRQALVNLLTSLRDLAIQGRSILEQHRGQVGDQLAALRSVTEAIAARQRDLGLLLVNLPIHNEALRRAVVEDFVQVLNDFVVCGLPNGGEVPDSPLNSCTFVPQEQGQ
jgi:phospholipid/cholesterol/gamma-HCH transport system substrate-binding protein